MITVQFKILPTPYQESFLILSSIEYIRCVNMLTANIIESEQPLKLSSASFHAKLPSTIKNEVVNTAKSVVKKYKSGACRSLPVLKKPVITWNNQNFKLVNNSLSFPLWIDGKSKRISVNCALTDYQINRLNTKLGSLWSRSQKTGPGKNKNLI